MGALRGLVEHDGKLFAAWKGKAGDERIFWSSWSEAGGWTTPATLKAATSTGPSLAAFDDHVWAAWKGEANDPRLFFARLNGRSWTAQAEIPRCYSAEGPELAAFGNRLVAVWKSLFDDSLSFSTFDGKEWARARSIPGALSATGASLAAFDGKLWAAWRGNQHEGVQFASFDGKEWSAGKRLPDAASSVGPSLASFGGKLWAVWKGTEGEEALFYASFDGAEWSSRARLPHALTTVGAAVTPYRQKLHAMWANAHDGRLCHASFDGKTWSAVTQDIPGETGQDSSVLVTPPKHGLGSNSNYFITAEGEKNVLDLSVGICLAGDLHAGDGFSFQLNCFAPHPTNEGGAVQQYVFVVEDDCLQGAVNNWPRKIESEDDYLIDEWFDLVDLESNGLFAGYELRLTLHQDDRDRITGATWRVTDQHGKSRANVKHTLLGFGESDFSTKNLAPINAFQIVLVGPANGDTARINADARGVFQMTAKNKLVCSEFEPAGDISARTTEKANSFYSRMPSSFADGDLWQAFTGGDTLKTISAPAAHGLRRKRKS